MCTNLRPTPKKYNELTKQQIIKSLEKLDKNTGSILLTGGEPTIRKDIFYILEYINQHFPKTKIQLITNARMFYYGGFIDKINTISNLNIITELHGSNEQLHDKITQTKGSYNQSFKGIKNMLNNNFRVELRIVVSKLNYKDILNLSKLYLDEFPNAGRIVIFPIDLIGNALKNRNETGINYTKTIPYIEKALELLKNKNVNVYHTPYCILDKKYWQFVGGLSVKDNRVVYAPFCKECIFEKKCPRIWKSYAKTYGFNEFEAIKDGSI